ncbi:MAG: metallophosphoesterase [Desulfobacteraceae bacterium]|nr:MAG: metallophosphoesterase [Desulfobacteraceae bacterium]
MIIGVISDTHGVLKQGALAALRGVDHIIHAGDVGSPEVISALRLLAPVTAVRGNIDRGAWAWSLPVEEMVVLDGKTFYVLHDVNDLALEPASTGIQVIVSGHTHQPLIKNAKDVLYFNPGSASQRRRGGPLSIGHIRISAQLVQPEIIHLDS